MEYYIIIPIHNEETFLVDCLESILQQSLLPKKVILVNDNSTDKSETIINAFVAENSLFQKLNTSSTPQHMPGSKVVNAFNKGMEQLDNNYDFLVKLDADIILPEAYFEKIAFIFKKHPKVGIAGGFAYEQDSNGNWILNHPMNKDHVRGAFKAYRKSCYLSINGLRTAMGWDTVDELLAQFHGYTIFTDKILKVKHLRPTGNAYNKQAKLLQGKAMFTMRYGFCISLIASLKMALKQKKTITFFYNLKGYFKAKKEKSPYLVTQKEGDFIRSLRWKAIKRKLFS